MFAMIGMPETRGAMKGLQKLTFKETITASMLLIAVVVFIAAGALWTMGELAAYDGQARAQKQEHINNQKALARAEVDRVVDFIHHQRRQTVITLKADLRARIDSALSVAESIYSAYAGSMSEVELQRRIVEALRNIRYDGEGGYFFIFDLEGQCVLMPHSPEHEGRALQAGCDSSGRLFIQRATEIINTFGEGFLDWNWFKPENQSAVKEKMGFVKRFGHYGWWIGTGCYVEDFTAEIQEKILEWVQQIRYGEDGYIFIYDYQANTLAHYKPENVGVNQWHFLDSNGVPVLQRLIASAREEGEGFVEYVGTIRPSTGLPAPKIAYVKGVQDWQWMVGTGLYVDAINARLAAKRQELFQKIWRHITIFFGLLLLSILPIYLLIRYLVGSVTDSVAVCTDFMEQAVLGGKNMEVGEVRFEEFHPLVRATNSMVDEQEAQAARLQELEEKVRQSRKMETLGMLAGGVAHDLNNILASMVGYPDILMNSLPAKSPQRKFLGIIKESGHKAADVVGDLLTLATQGGEQRMVLNLNDLVEKYLQGDIHGQTIERYGPINIELDLAPDLMKMQGVPVRLEKLLMHLLRTAAGSRLQRGRIRIRTENRYVDSFLDGLQQVEEGEYVVLQVMDPGGGIPREEISHIFEPFYLQRRYGSDGTGLGMVVIWETVQEHNGFINVTSDDGEGVIFELYFRATREDIAREAAASLQRDFRGHGERLLIVDDIKEQRDLAVALLNQLGYTTAAVPTGEEAVEYLRNMPVDLVVLDMILEDPYMDGLETYKRILQICPGQRAIIASGYAETARVKTALLMGVGEYVQKPYSVEKIGRAIRRVLDGQSLASGA